MIRCGAGNDLMSKTAFGFFSSFLGFLTPFGDCMASFRISMLNIPISGKPFIPVKFCRFSMFRISGLSIALKDFCMQSAQTVIPPGRLIIFPAWLSVR